MGALSWISLPTPACCPGAWLKRIQGASHSLNTGMTRQKVLTPPPNPYPMSSPPHHPKSFKPNPELGRRAGPEGVPSFPYRRSEQCTSPAPTSINQSQKRQGTKGLRTGIIHWAYQQLLGIESKTSVSGPRAELGRFTSTSGFAI